ncbi:hypothetical protein PR048_009388 [Dryococelus australis]|uniref:Uncharacterized protein n=1 Tax=Dryococelus australis TaxID=614101 RepID=A0ABQ9I1K4_9NEOP|nr:hypothetical protein PR048_009388 [Dryococelus australis]
MRDIEVSMEQRRNEKAGETGDPRENPPANGIVRHDLHLREFGKLGLAEDFVFQQDNDPKHTAMYNDSRRLLNLPQSPNVDPIEHLRNLSRQTCTETPPFRQALQRLLLEEWFKISPAHTTALVRTMPRRLAAVTLAKENMERRRNQVAGEARDPRENPPTNGIVRHDSHLRKSGDPGGD